MYEHPIKAGLRKKCGQCGEGDLYRAFLKFKPRCDRCEQDFGVADTADGPAFFVGFLIMIVFAPFYFIVPAIDVSLIVKIVLMTLILGAMFGAALWLLPRFKGVLLNLQIRNRAEEAHFSKTGKHGVPPKNWRH